jgi:hypothetical protein
VVSDVAAMNSAYQALAAPIAQINADVASYEGTAPVPWPQVLTDLQALQAATLAFESAVTKVLSDA